MTAIPLAIVGATASGKSSLAMRLAALDSRIEIVSADSMQVYRGMDIGTAKATRSEQEAVPHHLIDVAEPDDDYTLSRYVADVDRAVGEIVARGGVPVLVGGTGLYVRGVIDDFEVPGRYADVRAELDAEPDTAALFDRLCRLDPVASERMEPGNRRRIVRALEVTLGSGRRFSDWGPGVDAYPPIATRQIVCDRPRPSLDRRIDGRYDVQMQAGFLAEVEGLVEGARTLCRTARQALGYRELLRHLEDGEPLDEMLDEAKRRTRRFARRQQRWFRRDPRPEWVDLDSADLDAVLADLHHGLADWPGT